MATPIVSDATELDRFEAHLDGVLCGTLTYINKRERLALIHTEVLPAFEGKGVGSAITRFALDSARERGLKVIVMCPFVRSYLDRHPEHNDIVVGGGAPASG